MKPNNRSSHTGDQGLSLIELMVSAGLLTVVIMGFVTMVTNQQKESRALAERMAALDLQRLLLSTFNDSVCRFVLTDPTQSSTATPPNRSKETFNSTNPNDSIQLRKLPMNASATSPLVAEVGQVASPISGFTVVQSIALKNMTGASDNYTAQIEVTFDSTRLVRPIKPVVVQTALQTAGPANAKTIIGCSMASSGPSPKRGYCSGVASPDNTGTHSCPAATPGYTRVELRGVFAGVVQQFDCCYIPDESSQGFCSPPVIHGNAGGGYWGCNNGNVVGGFTQYKYHSVHGSVGEWTTCCFVPIDRSRTGGWCGPQLDAWSIWNGCPAPPGYTVQLISTVTGGVGNSKGCCFVPN